MFKKVIRQIPNALTLSRLAIGLFVLPPLFFTGNFIGLLIAFIVGASTDLVDGFLARTLNAESDFGKKADPFVDKFLGGSALLLLSIFNWPIFSAACALELGIGVFNLSHYIKGKKNVNAVPIGKVKTVVLAIAIVLGLISTLTPAVLYAVIPFIAVSNVLQVISFIKYIKRIKEYKKENLEVEIEKEDVKNLEEADKEETTLEQKLQKKSRKEKYLDLQRIAHDIVEAKENWERSIGEKAASRKLKK